MGAQRGEGVGLDRSWLGPSPVEVALLLDATAAGAVGSQWVDSVLQRASAVLHGPVTPAMLRPGPTCGAGAGTGCVYA